MPRQAQVAIIRRELGAQLTRTRILKHGAFIGDAYIRRDVSGFSMGAWFVPESSTRAKPHGHVEPHFMFALSGAYHTLAEGRQTVDLPLLIYNPPQTYHHDHFVSRGSFFSVSLTRVE